MTQPNFDTPMQSGTSTPSTGGLTKIAGFPTYLEAQKLVDKMSDDGFPVQYVRIVGDDLRLVEHVTGRMTMWKAALMGAAGGAWFGLFIGLLFGLFTAGYAWIEVVLTALIVGAVAGGVFGLVGHWMTRGQRDFSSFQTLEAARYDVYVDAAHGAEAQRYVQTAT